MTLEFEKNLKKYAEVIVKVGLNLQPGQRLLIGGPRAEGNGGQIELAPLIRLIAIKAYQCGARFVDVMWDDEQLKLIRFQHAPRDSFEEYPTWRTDELFNYANNGDAVLFFADDNPDLLTGQDLDLISTTIKTFRKFRKPFSDLQSKNALNWSGIAAPTESWAQKVFPYINSIDRKAKFWDTIFEICRVKEKDPIAAWKEHINQLAARSSFMTRKQYLALKMTGPGTDLTIGLPKEHIWRSAGFKNQQGIRYVGNIPTEEIFTMPHKDKTEGIVTATKPLPRGALIEDFSLTFSEGRVIKVTAKKGEDLLHKLFEIDEGANRLGEVALVPHSSPISQTKILFYNVLIDENASCHIALGRGFKFSLKNGEQMTDEEFAAAGGNISIDHVDFMIGSEKLNIDGILESGKTEPIMRNGEWAFEV